MALRRLLAVAVVALGLAACVPIKPPAPGESEHSQCVRGAETAKAHRPDLVLIGYECANYGGTGWVGYFQSNVPYIRLNTYYTHYDPSGGPGGGYYCVAAHEWGHAWDWYRLGWTHDGWTSDPEAYANMFAHVYFGC